MPELTDKERIVLLEERLTKLQKESKVAMFMFVLTLIVVGVLSIVLMLLSRHVGFWY